MEAVWRRHGSQQHQYATASAVFGQPSGYHPAVLNEIAKATWGAAEVQQSRYLFSPYPSSSRIEPFLSRCSLVVWVVSLLGFAIRAAVCTLQTGRSLESLFPELLGSVLACDALTSAKYRAVQLLHTLEAVPYLERRHCQKISKYTKHCNANRKLTLWMEGRLNPVYKGQLLNRVATRVHATRSPPLHSWSLHYSPGPTQLGRGRVGQVKGR